MDENEGKNIFSSQNHHALMMNDASPSFSSNSTSEMDTIDPGSKVVVRVEDNDKKMLDELFNLKSNSHLKSKPLKDRNLPQSFFKTQHTSSKQLCRQLLSSSSNQNPFAFDQFPQPNTGSTTFPGANTPFPGATTPFPGATTPFPGATTPFPGANTPFPGATQTPLNPNMMKARSYPHSNHTRSRSSPATCYGQNNLQPPVTTEFGIQDYNSQQPQQQQQPQTQPQFHQENWMEQMEERRAQQSGFHFTTNEQHPNISTHNSIEFPTISHPNSRMMQHQNSAYPIRHNRAHSQVDHMTLTLPKGWERGITPEGDVFYIDHNTRSTSWTHPSLPQHTSGLFPQPGMGSPQHRPSWFQPGELSTIREIAQQQHLFSRLNINDDSNYSHSHQGSQDSGIGIAGTEQAMDPVQPMESFLLSKLENSPNVPPQLLHQDSIPFPGSNMTLTDDSYIGNPSEVTEFPLNFDSSSPSHYVDVSNLTASISTEMLLDAVTGETNISQS